MRITNNMLINNMTYNLNSSLKRMEMLQYQSTKGKKFRLPSDDPIGASKSLKFNTDLSKIEQYQRNTEDAGSWMKETEGALVEINKVLKRAHDLTIQAANDTNGEERDKINAEIKELKEHIIQIGNTTYAGRSIFTGYKTDKDLLNEDGTYKVDITNGETFVYNVGISETVAVNTLGNKVFGSGEAGNPDYKTEITNGTEPYLIAMFNKLEGALTSSNQEDLQTSLTDIDDAMNNILSVTAEIGAKTNRLEMTSSKLKDQKLNLEELLSFNEDIDRSEAYMRLSMERNAYTAGLSIGAKIIQPSLMDFLR